MTAAQLAAKIRYYTKTNSTTFADSDMLPLVNDTKDELASLITQRNNSYFIVPATATLTASQREYAWPSDVLNHLISVEVAFDQTTPIPYVKCEPTSFGSLDFSLTEANVTNRYSNIQPHYFRRRRAIYLLTGDISSATLGASTVSAGIRMMYRAFPADLANLTSTTTDLGIDPTTTTFGMPKQFHELWGRRVSIIWKQGRPKPIPLSDLEKRYDTDLELALEAISREDFDEEITTPVPIQPYNSGYDL